MNRRTVLKTTGCDVKRLPLGAREAFFLSQLDGHVSVEEAASVAGLSLDEAVGVAKQLVELGAVVTYEAPAPASTRSGKAAGAAIERDGRSERVDPRAEEWSGPEKQTSMSRRTIDARSEPEEPPRPAPTRPAPIRRPTPRPARRSRNKLDATKPVETKAAAEKAPPLGEAQAAEIAALDAKLGAVDHYALLDVRRTASKKSIKRAYFGLAAKYHPDRFFGKDLGSARAPLERIFARVTAAHDTLADAERRAAYDATLPRAEPVEASPPPPPAGGSQVSAVIAKRPRVETAPEPEAPPPSTLEPPPPSSSYTASPERIRQLKAAAMQIKAQANIELLVKAAEDALLANDLVGAANNLRLALSHGEDPILRMKFEDVDARARILRFEKNIGPAKAAERELRWAEAAHFFERAHEARPDADAAARAASALRVGGGDLGRAVTLAKQAVDLDKKNVAHHVTLVEVCLAAGRLADAAEACSAAQSLAPKDTRLKELAATIATKSKAS